MAKGKRKDNRPARARYRATGRRAANKLRRVRAQVRAAARKVARGPRISKRPDGTTRLVPRALDLQAQATLERLMRAKQ